MRIRTIPVCLTKREHQRFVKDYPVVKDVLTLPVVEEDGTSSDLVVFRDNEDKV
jgi:hypothetical protein